MKKITWNLHTTWDAVKLLVTRNLWLKIVAFLLAFATYSALKDKTKDVSSDATEKESRLYESLREYMQKPDNAPHAIKNCPASNPDKSSKEQ